MKCSTNRMLAAILAALFGLLLTYHSLTSSDFTRGIYGQPNSGHWAHFDSLNPNRVWNYSYTWGGVGSLAEYLAGAGQWNIKPFLRLDSVEFDTFYLEYYSCAQHHIYEAELDYDSSSNAMADERPDLFYFFHHASAWNGTVRGELDPNEPQGGASWRCTQGASYGPGVMLQGPNETLEGEDDNATWASHRCWPDTTVDRDFKSIIRVMADLDGLSSSDTIFYWQIRVYTNGINDTLAEGYYTADSFAGVSAPQWKQFELEYTIPNAGFNLLYTVDWKNKCDVWVDWIEFYDMNRGRYLFTDQNTRDSVLGLIAYQCEQIEEDYPDILAGWKQSDEPPRSAFNAHGVVNLMARTGLQHPPITPNNQLSDISWFLQRPDLFVLVAKPPILEIDVYPFKGPDATGTHYFGSQAELDTLAARLERCYHAAADSSIPLYYTGQGHQLWKDYVLKQRNPTKSEIFAESFMALAHGAKGVTFFRYRGSHSAGDTCRGLVEEDFSHSSPYFADKWQAVQDIFAQLDSVGDTLLLLEREAAYCIYPNANFQDPIDSIFFAENDTDYIEVGQFQDASDNEYLILVNRRTNADRHITVKTSLSGTWAMRDLYTQERFLSSTGDFYSIPFDSGEGRVFKLNAY